MNNNFYEYLQDLNKNIKLKILKREYKIKYLKQIGGASNSLISVQPKINIVERLKTEVDRLKVIREVIDQNIHLADKTRYDAAHEQLKNVTTKLEELTKTLDLPGTNIDNLESFLNKLSLFDSQITRKDGSVRIDLEKHKDIIIAPVITPEFQKLPGELINEMNKEMEEVIKKINELDRSDNEHFKELNKDIDNVLRNIKEKIAEIIFFNTTISKKIIEINESLGITTFKIDDKCFIINNSEIIDLISIEQLYGMTQSQKQDEQVKELNDTGLKRQQQKVSDRITVFNPDFKKIDIDSLIIPRFETMRGGMYYIIPDKLRQITINIYEIWVKKMKIIGEGERQKNIEEYEKNRSDIDAKYLELNDNIRENTLIIDKIIERYQNIKKIYRDIDKKIKEEIKTIKKNIDELNKSIPDLLESHNSKIIYSKIEKANTELLKIKDKIVRIDDYFVRLKKEIKDEKNKTYQSDIGSIQERLGVLENKIVNPEKINRMNDDYINKIISIFTDDKHGYKILKLLTLDSYSEITNDDTNKQVKEKRMEKIVKKFKFDPIRILECYKEKCNNQVNIDKFISDRKKKGLTFKGIIFSKLEGPDSDILDISSVKKEGIEKLYDKIIKNNELIINKEKNDQETKEKIKELKNEMKQIQTEYDKQQNEIDQYGGSFEEWNLYRDKLVIMRSLIDSYKKEYNQFNINVYNFNKLYIDLYFHQLYITSYIERYLMHHHNTIYNYISRGMIYYYLDIIKRIKKFINEKQGDKVIDYFKKNHQINLLILENFLQKLFDNWSLYLKINITDEKQREKMNTTKLNLLDDRITDPKLKFNIFLFNMFKDILDTYSSLYSPPVGAYLRINDVNKKLADNLKIFYSSDNVNLIEKSLDKCSELTSLKSLQQITSNDDIKNLSIFIKNVKNMGFKSIFDPYGFENNETLSLYMSIPNFLSQSRSILIITYGYSGVGKTFTIFGNQENHGILQKSLQNIRNKKGIKVRAFEIYGVALPYKSYWNNKTPENYNHSIFSYEYPYNSGDPIEYKDERMKKYLDEIKNPFDTDDTYTELNDKDINDFNNYIKRIDAHRTKVGRIKETINNPVSSRSIIIFEFKIKIDDDKQVYFIIMDLPGKEDVKGTYVYNDNISDKKYGINIKKKIIKDYPMKDKNNDPLRAAIFLNPMFISVFPKIAKQFISSNLKIDTYYKVLYKGQPYFKHTLKQILELKSILDNDILHDFGKGINGLESNSNNNIVKQNFFNSFKSAEFFRYIIDNNLLNVLIDFYNHEILDLSPEQIEQNYGALPFEAFYINENILDLIDVLGKKVNKDYVKNKEKIMPDFFNENVNIKDHKSFGNEFSNEQSSQSYFMRDLLREKLSFDPNTVIKEYDTLLFHPYSNEEYNNGFRPEKKTLKEWFENMYVFNKSFIGKDIEPPIKTFLNNYFDEITREDGTLKNFIDNIYLFYVVQNDHPEKCVNQIKLISDSKDFLDIINNWK